MADPTFSPTGSTPTPLSQSLARLSEQMPLDRKGVALVGLEWKYGLPFMTFGTAARIGKHFQVAGDVETRFSKLSSSGKVYAAWSW